MRPPEPEADALYQFLNPHDVDCLIIMVPHNHQARSMVLRVLSNAEVLGILLMFTLFLCTNILIKWSDARRNVVAHCFRTFGVCMAQNHAVVHNRREMLWTVGISLFGVISNAQLSAVVYRTLMQEQTTTQPIRTMDDLARSELTIYVDESLLAVGSWYTAIE